MVIGQMPTMILTILLSGAIHLIGIHQVGSPKMTTGLVKVSTTHKIIIRLIITIILITTMISGMTQYTTILPVMIMVGIMIMTMTGIMTGTMDTAHMITIGGMTIVGIMTMITIGGTNK